MIQCKLCGNRWIEHYLRQVDHTVAELIRTYFGIISFDNNDKVCVWCAKDKLKVYLESSGKILKIGNTCVWIEDQSSSIFTGKNDHSSPRSTLNYTTLMLHLQYIKSNRTLFKGIHMDFSSDSTIESVINHLIKTLALQVTRNNIILTMVKSTDQQARPIKSYTPSQTLSSLGIKNEDHLRFEYCDETTTKHDRGMTGSSLSGSPFCVLVKYLKTGHTEEFQFNNDSTIAALFSFISKKFQLEDVDSTYLQLSSNHVKLDTTNNDRTLVSMEIPTKYPTLDLIKIPERKSKQMNNQAINQSKHVMIKCCISPLEITVDLSTARTDADLKQKIIDQLKIQHNCSLKADDIDLRFDQNTFKERDGDRLLAMCDTANESNLKVVIDICSNRSSTSQPIRNEINVIENDSSSKNEECEVSSSVLVTPPKRTNPVGLRNLTNTCFMNSTLQCLSHVPPLTSFFLSTIKKEHVSKDKNSNPFDNYGEVTSAYAKFIWNMWEGQESVFSPHQIREEIGKIAPTFSTNDQQDAQEFMIFLLTAMHDETKVKNNDIINKLFFGNITSITTCLQCKQPKVTSNVISFLPVPLVQYKRSFTVYYIPYDNRGEEKMIVEVIASGRIEHLLYTFTQQRMLYNHHLRVFSRDNSNRQFTTDQKLSEILEHTLTICNEGYDKNISYTPPPQFEDGLTLTDCIREFLTLESIENAWFCKGACNALTYAVKQMQFCSLPPVLVIQLKRFTNGNGYRRKLDTLVKFPINELNLNEFLPKKSSCAINATYDLFAVSNHMGSIHSGHYTAYARQEINGVWYDFNDESVSQFHNDDFVVSKNAYLLVYLRRERNNVE